TKDVMLRRNQKSRVAVAVIAIVLVAFAGRLPGPALHGGAWHSLPVPGDFYVAFMGRLYGHSLSGWLAAWLGIIAVVVAGAADLYWLSRRWGPSVAAPSPHQPSAAARQALPGGGAPLVRSMGSVGHHFRAAHPRVSDRHHGDCGDDRRSLPHLRTVGRCLHGDLGGGRNVAGCDARRDPGQRPLQPERA